MSLKEESYKDIRGEIRKLEFCGIKFNVLYTKKGYLRSGDYHKNTQYDLVLKGKCEIKMIIGKKDVVIKSQLNKLIKIPPKIPHLFKFLEDTIMIEWWDGQFEAKYYKPFRKLIENQLLSNPQL